MPKRTPPQPIRPDDESSFTFAFGTGGSSFRVDYSLGITDISDQPPAEVIEMPARRPTDEKDPA